MNIEEFKQLQLGDKVKFWDVDGEYDTGIVIEKRLTVGVIDNSMVEERMVWVKADDEKLGTLPFLPQHITLLQQTKVQDNSVGIINMTSEQFVALYEGREVEINTMYGIGDPLVSHGDRQKYIGKRGIVKKVEYSSNKGYVSVFMTQYGKSQAFLPCELDVIKQSPLPLPG